MMFFCSGIFIVVFSFYIFRYIDFNMKEYRKNATTVNTQIDMGLKEEYMPGTSVCEQILTMEDKIQLYVGSQNMNAKYRSGESVLNRIQGGDYDLLYAIVSTTALYRAEYVIDTKDNIVSIKYVKTK